MKELSRAVREVLLLSFEHCISLSVLVVDGSTTLVVTWASAISNVFSRFSNMDSVRTLSQEDVLNQPSIKSEIFY